MRLTPAALFLAALPLAFAQSQPASLSIQGDIPAPLTLAASDLAHMTRQTLNVTAEDGSPAAYEGVPLREVLKRAGLPQDKDVRGNVLTTYILAKAHDGYQAVFSLGEIDPNLGNAPIIIADKRDGKPLAANQGPLRLVCGADKAHARSVRMLEILEIVRIAK